MRLSFVHSFTPFCFLMSFGWPESRWGWLKWWVLRSCPWGGPRSCRSWPGRCRAYCWRQGSGSTCCSSWWGSWSRSGWGRPRGSFAGTGPSSSGWSAPCTCDCCSAASGAQRRSPAASAAPAARCYRRFSCRFPYPCCCLLPAPKAVQPSSPWSHRHLSFLLLLLLHLII